MAVYTIIRVYEVPAENRIEATERMLEALDLRSEHDFHVKDYIREPGEKAGKGRQVDLRPAAGWVQLFLEQLGLIKSSLSTYPSVSWKLAGGSRQGTCLGFRILVGCC